MSGGLGLGVFIGSVNMRSEAPAESRETPLSMAWALYREVIILELSLLLQGSQAKCTVTIG